MKKYTVVDIKDNIYRLTEEEEKQVLKHCNKYSIKPEICAWYKDWDDFCYDWCEKLGYTKTEARKLLQGKSGNEGEYKKFANGTIVRFVI